ncbi:MAG: FAD-dependent oxidoreductase, partial [Kiritimatiellia bacterium]
IAWALPFTDQTCERVKMGEWTWETGMSYHQVNEFERVRDYGMLVVFSNWSFLKNHSANKADYAKSRLDWVAYVAGKRESRRLIGDLVLKEQDLVGRVAYPDATAVTTWTIDLHYPAPKNARHFPGAEFKSIAKHKAIHPYPIPYRCLYSKNVENLFMAGRNISVTHVALGTVRVMRTGGMMGEVVGMAASLCKKHGCLPRDVYATHLEELKGLMARGVGLGQPQPPQQYNLGGTLMKSKKE